MNNKKTIPIKKDIHNMKNILLIAYDINPDIGSECGNAYVWLKILDENNNITLITDNKHKEALERENWKNVKFRYIPLDDYLTFFFKKLKLYNLANYVFFNRIFKREKQTLVKNFDFIHIITPAGIHSYNTIYKLNIPYIIGPLGGGLDTPKNFSSIFYSVIIREILRKSYYKIITKYPIWRRYYTSAHKLIIGTSYIKDYLPKETVPRQLEIFDTHVDTSFFKEANVNIKKDIIIFIGRLEPQKGCQLLLSAFKKIKNKHLNWKLLIIGDGPLNNKLREYVTKNMLDSRVQFKKELNRIQIRENLNNSKIFCLPTIREPGGSAILEAMASGLPIITSNYGGPFLSVNKDCGILINLINPKQYKNDISKALDLLMTNSKLRRRMGENSRERALKEFSFVALRKKIEELYK